MAARAATPSQAGAVESGPTAQLTGVYNPKSCFLTLVCETERTRGSGPLRWALRRALLGWRLESDQFYLTVLELLSLCPTK